MTNDCVVNTDAIFRVRQAVRQIMRIGVCAGAT